LNFVLRNPEKKGFHKILSSKTVSIIIRKKHQISISDWFLKDHVTLKIGVMMPNIQLCYHRNKLHFKIH